MTNTCRLSLLALLLLTGVSFLTGQAPAPAETEAEAPAPVEETPSDTTTPSQQVVVGSATLSLPAGAKVAILPVEGMIYDFVLESLERRVNRAVQDGADIIVLELDTYGGQVTSAIEISKFLKGPKVPVPVVAWVNTKAYSAGIMIASACDFIIMADASSTGDCAPIVPGQELAATERAKAFSPIASEFQDSATRNGYDYATFHAMCVLGVELYLIEHKDTGERKIVNQVDYALMVSSAERGTKAGHAMHGMASKSAIVEDNVAPVERMAATDADLGMWTPVETLPSGANAPKGMIHSGKALFTPGNILAEDIGLSQATATHDADVAATLKASGTTRIAQTWSENIAGYLTNPVVRGILVLALLLGAYIEFQTPGFGMGGAVAVAALLCLLGAPFIVGLAEIWHILLFLAGLILLIIELAFTPSFGLLGVLGLGMMFAGLVLSAIPSSGSGPLPLPSPMFVDRLIASMASTLMGFVAGIIGFYFLAKHFGSIPVLSRLMLTDHQLAYSQVPGADVAPIAGDEVFGEGRIRVGDTGHVSHTGLRPTGRAVFNGETIDVVSLGSFVDPETPVRVVEARGNHIVVDTIES